jgi:hypothetical protein
MRAKEFISGTKTFVPSGIITNESITAFLQKTSNTLDGRTKFKIVEHMAEHVGKLINEVIDTELLYGIQKYMREFAVNNAVIGARYIPVTIHIFNDQIIVHDVMKQAPPKVRAVFGILTGEDEFGYRMKIGKKNFDYDASKKGNYSMMLTGLFDTVDNYDKFRMIMKLKYEQDLPPVDPNSLEESASGYIPSNAQKNDPRYKTGLTKDVRPDTIKKNAKAFGFKTTRAGIPLQANANGKVPEAFIKHAPKKDFVNEREEVEYICNHVKNPTEKLHILEAVASRNIHENNNKHALACDQVITQLGSLSTKNPK